MGETMTMGRLDSKRKQESIGFIDTLLCLPYSPFALCLSTGQIVELDIVEQHYAFLTRER